MWVVKGSIKKRQQGFGQRFGFLLLRNLDSDVDRTHAIFQERPKSRSFVQLSEDGVHKKVLAGVREANQHEA